MNVNHDFVPRRVMGQTDTKSMKLLGRATLSSLDKEMHPSMSCLAAKGGANANADPKRNIDRLIK